MTKTAIVYDPFNLKHTMEGHPENHRRLERTWALLQEAGVLERLLRVPSGEAPLEAILRLHAEKYVRKVRRMSQRGGGFLDQETYVTPHTYQAALLAAGGLLNLVDAVLEGLAHNGFALVRPPGHHALYSQGMGFCIFGNVAIAARHAQEQHGLERILIVDFDVHHGNGTQDMFYQDDSVLFFSTHQYPFWPGSGGVDEIGAGPGKGFTVNVPLPAGTGDQGYLATFREILAPVAQRFRPQLILVSAGYDPHWMDPLANQLVSITGFGQLIQELMALADGLCDGRLVCTLEGGYNLQALPHCILTSLRTLSQDPEGVSDPFGPPPTEEEDISQRIAQVKAAHGLA